MGKTKVMICGASGFIGRNLFEHFEQLDDNYEVFGTYLKNPSKVLNPRLIQTDLRDKDRALRATQGVDIVINAAAMTDGVGVFSAKEKVAEYAADNNLINANLAEAGYVNRVGCFIFLSCTVMYPSSLVPLKESEFDLVKVHPKYYIPARMKIQGEDCCRNFASHGKTKYTAIRHTNVYGQYDKFDLARGHVLAATITKVMRAKDQITVWGKGEEFRDFLHISDLIEFIEKAIEKQESNFEIFNVGFGKTYSVNELVEKIIFCSGKKLSVVHDLERPTVEAHMNIDVEKARRLLSWKAQTDLNDGLRKTIEWYINHSRTHT